MMWFVSSQVVTIPSERTCSPSQPSLAPRMAKPWPPQWLVHPDLLCWRSLFWFFWVAAKCSSWNLSGLFGGIFRVVPLVWCIFHHLLGGWSDDPKWRMGTPGPSLGLIHALARSLWWYCLYPAGQAQSAICQRFLETTVTLLYLFSVLVSWGKRWVQRWRPNFSRLRWAKMTKMTKMTCCHHVLHIFTCFHTYRFMHSMYFDFFDVVFVIWQPWNVEHDLVQQNQLGIRLLNRWGHELARWQSCPGTWRDQLRQIKRRRLPWFSCRSCINQVRMKDDESRSSENWNPIINVSHACLGGSKVSSQCPWPLWKLLRRELIYCARPKLMTFWQRLDDAGQGAAKVSGTRGNPWDLFRTVKEPGVFCCHLSGYRSQMVTSLLVKRSSQLLTLTEELEEHQARIKPLPTNIFLPTIRDRCITSCGVAQSDARLCWDPIWFMGAVLSLCYRLKKGT